MKFNWVLNNELAVGSAPSKNEHFHFLKSKGISSVLSLCSSDEITLCDLIEKNFEFSYFPLPDHSYGRNPSVSEILNALRELEKLKKFGPVYVHCYAGIERSPLICMAWLINKKKMNTNEALEYMMEVHPRTCPLSSQLKILNDDLITKN